MLFQTYTKLTFNLKGSPYGTIFENEVSAKFNKICRSLMQYINLPLNTIISFIVFIMPHEAWKENRKL